MISYITREKMLPTKIQCKITYFLPYCFATTTTVGDTGVTNRI